MDMQEYIDKHSSMLKKKDEKLKQRVDKAISMQKLLDSMYDDFRDEIKGDIEELKEDIDSVREDLNRCEEAGSRLTPRNMYDSTENIIKNSNISKSVRTKRFIEWLHES